MDVQARAVDSLIPYSFNNRIHSTEQVSRIATSISEFGFNQPIVVDEQSVVLVGHGRLLAAQKLGLDVVPVLQLTGLSEAKKRAYRILDNKLQNDSEWALENLKLELDVLEEEGFELAAWGLDTLLPDEETAEVTEDEFEPQEIEEPYIKTGDLIELGEHRLLCGDSTDEASLAELLRGEKAQMMFTDPPYGVAYTGGHFHSGDVDVKRERESLANDDDPSIYPNFLAVALQHVDGPCYTWFADSKAFEVYKAVKDLKCQVHALIIWHKINAKYAAMNAQYKQRHEPCLYFKPKGSTLRWCGPSNECTIWEEKRDGVNKYHPTQKPITLAARALKNHNAASVLDVFLGSGSTLIAAEQLGRKCFGMEISPKYCQVILERYKAHCEQAGKPFVCRINGEPFDGNERA